MPEVERQIPWYYRSLDFEKLWREFPPPPDYFDTRYRISRDELHALQEKRFLRQIDRGWQVPFYRRRWSDVGLEPGDLKCLDDLGKIPPYTVDDIRKSIELNPPWGDYLGIDLRTDSPMPLILQTSGGTTGTPRPMMYAPQDREVMNIMMGRRLYMQGVRPFDLVQVAMALGLQNAGIASREGIWKYTGAIPVMTGSGANTPSRRQIELAREWGVKFLAGFPAYIRHLALVARDELKIDPHSFKLKGLLVHLGVDDREALEALWGAEVFDTYGIHECGSIACDCAHKSGMHIFEDAYLVEILDPDTRAPKELGEHGTLHVTTLFRHLAPVIRYNVNDVSSIAAGTCICGSTHRRLENIYGRSDSMVKLRGVNIFPEAIGGLVSANPRCNGEYVCIVETVDAAGRDEMTVQVERLNASVDGEALTSDLMNTLKIAMGLRIQVQVVDKGKLDAITGTSQVSKIKRLIDRRKSL